MILHYFRLLAAIFLMALSVQASAATAADCKAARGDKRELHVIVENDLFAEKLGLAPSDRWYTSGVKFMGKINQQEPPWWYSKTWETLTIKPPGEYCMEYGFTLGQMMYTPADIRQAGPQVNDRYWGGWLYLGTIIQSQPRRQRQERRDELETFELDIGVVGPWALGEQSQKAIHKLIGSPMPEGWKQQLRNEIGIQTTYLRALTWRQTQLDWLHADLAAHYGFGAGTVFNYVNAGATLRFGNNLSGAPVGTIEMPSLLAFENPTNRFYVLARVDARYWLHNTFVDGSLLRSDPHNSTIRARHIVLQATLGLVLETRQRSLRSLAFLFHRRSAEFNSAPGQAKYQNFGTLMLELDF